MQAQRTAAIGAPTYRTTEPGPLLDRCGRRRSPATMPQMGDLDRATDSVHVANGKNGKARIVPMCEYGWELLDPWLDARAKLLTDPSSGPVFCTIAQPVCGGPLASSYVRKMLKDCCEFCGITRRITCHTLRHTFASELLSEGVELLVISHMLGHSNIATTNIYVNHLPSDKLREAMAGRPRPMELVA